MGGGTSSRPSTANPELVYPTYYIDEPVTQVDLRIACQSWALIVEDRGDEYLAHKDVINTCCITWFYMTFYNRFFELAPETKKLFKREIDHQGKMIVSVITFSLNSFYDAESLAEKMRKLAVVHASYGVISSQYGAMGDALLWSLGKVLGPQFDKNTMLAWTKIYSSMLKIILPVAIEEEGKLRLLGDKRDTGPGAGAAPAASMTP
jgi:hemoglobin-like flavoprotein